MVYKRIMGVNCPVYYLNLRCSILRKYRLFKSMKSHQGQLFDSYIPHKIDLCNSMILL